MIKTMTCREAIRGVLFQEMGKNHDMVMLGENYRFKGSIFSQVITPEFQVCFGRDRVIETPVAENGIIGVAFGAALAGMTAVPEIYSADFLFCIGTEIVNDITKWRYQHQYKEPINLVIRTPMGVHAIGGGGPEHSQCPEAYLHNTPGLIVVAPGSVKDSVGLLRSSLKNGNPVLFLEHRCIYNVEEEIDLEESFTVPIGKAKVIKTGQDCTILAWGLMRLRAEEAAATLEEEGVAVEIIDPRTIKPMDYETIYQSVAKTGKLLIVEETPRTGSIAGEIITSMMEREEGIKYGRLTMPDIPYHYIPTLEATTIPSTQEIINNVKKML